MAILLEKIRAKTQSSHEELEQTLRLFEKCTTRVEYLAVLKMFFGFYSPLVETVSSLGTKKDAEQVALRVQWLVDDLEALGVPQKDLSTIAICSDLPVFKSENDVLGFRYVLEGSTLGGQVIRRHFRGLWKQEDDRALRFFCAHGENTGPNWRLFMQNLEKKSAELSEADQTQVVHGAELTFQKLRNWASRI